MSEPLTNRSVNTNNQILLTLLKMKNLGFWLSTALMALFCITNLKAQDVTTWSTERNGSIIPDTVALEDYLPVKNNIVQVERVVELPNTTKQELFSRAKLAIQKAFTNNKLGTSIYDAESGICSINNFYDISDITAVGRMSEDPRPDKYFFNGVLSLIVKDGKYKIKIEVPDYAYGEAAKYTTYADFLTAARPVSELANRKQNNKRQRMRVLKTLNEKMLLTFNVVQKEMSKKLDTEF
jgi:hypothetical protein